MNDELNKILEEKDLFKKTEFLIHIFKSNETILNQNINIEIDFKKEDEKWWKEIQQNLESKKKQNSKEKKI